MLSKNSQIEHQLKHGKIPMSINQENPNFSTGFAIFLEKEEISRNLIKKVVIARPFITVYDR